MSIPKEPRQLMINLMYLVLTALLALNVSAEIFNAFKLVDKGLQKSNAVLDAANEPIPAQVAKLAKKKPELQTYADRANPVRQLSKEFNSYVDEIVTELIDKSGNKNGEIDDGDYKIKGNTKKLKGVKNKDVTTKYLVMGGKGEELKQKIIDTRAKFLEYIDDSEREAFFSNIALEVDDESWKLSKDKKSWADFNFRQMPVGALLPMFSKFKNDAKATESAVLNYLLSKVGGEDIVLDKFQVVSSPKKTYVIKGESFETEVFLSASASQASNTGVSISVNGRSLPVKDGVATFKESAGSTGIRKYTASITVTNPVTGEKNTYKNNFEYEVGLRSANVSADKMNVFYIGVSNPVSVTAAGVSTNDLKVNGSGGGIKMKPAGKGKYDVTVNKPGEASITVAGGGLQSTKFPFRVKRIPDPVPVLGAGPNKKGGAMGNGEFKAQGGLATILENFDFDAKCKVMGYELTRVAKRQDPVSSNNAGARYNQKSKRLVNAAKPGDTYYFDNVKSKCPGDAAGRRLPSIVFKIR
ncbi:MAG: gliding motility protein GldM [Bacteroidota bacterium]